MSKIAVLGSGMAAFGAVHRLHSEGVGSTAYDKMPFLGGHTASYTYDDKYVFDDGPHVSFTKDPRLQELFAGFVNNDFQKIDAAVNNYWQGHWVKHPAQCNLHGLPEDLVVKCLNDFIHAQFDEPAPIHNYRDWLYASYGRTFADTFPCEYGHKYHTAKAEQMSTDWLGPRLYRPDLEEVLRGALSPETEDIHYAGEVRYPTHGGFGAYLKPLPTFADLKLDHEVVGIDPASRTLSFKNGTEAIYDHVISSIPLPELIPMIAGVPNEVSEACGKLAATNCVMVNVVIDRSDLTDATWTYFYDKDFSFTRLSFPYKYSAKTVPEGASSLQAELYFSQKYRPQDIEPDDAIEPVVRDLKRCGLIREDDKILFTNATACKYANVIFDLDRAGALATVHGFLDEVGIRYVGRYGEWGYHWTDESFISGENAAQAILDGNSA